MTPNFLIVVLLMALSSLLTLADEVNIDCGSLTSTMDGWVGDGDYTQSGETKTVPSGKSKNQVMDTLRVFTAGKKNCYSIPSSSEQRLLVRANFYYGNYDQRSSPPSFDLLLNDNHWHTVDTSSSEVVSYEAIYVVKAGARTSVCVAQTSLDMLPFISAIEVRSLSSSLYTHFSGNGALFLSNRNYIDDTIGSYIDKTGRLWHSMRVPSDNMVRNEAPSVDVSSAEDNPPDGIFTYALTVPNLSNRFAVTADKLPATSVPVYVNMYFSEVTDVASAVGRSFHISVNDEVITRQPIVPPYGSVLEYPIYNVMANFKTQFALIPTSGSTLPPILSALEVFVISDVPADSDSDSGSGGSGSDSSLGEKDYLSGSGGSGSDSSLGEKDYRSGDTKTKSKLPIIIGIGGAIVVVVMAIVGIMVMLHHKRKSAATAAAHAGQAGGPNSLPDKAQI